MITMRKYETKNPQRNDEFVGAVARMAYAGSIHGYEKIVAARIWLKGHIRRAGDEAWAAGRKVELEDALDEWENEGGGLVQREC